MLHPHSPSLAGTRNEEITHDNSESCHPASAVPQLWELCSHRAACWPLQLSDCGGRRGMVEHGACLCLEMTFPVGGKPSPGRTTLGVIPQTLSSLRFEAGFHTGARGSLICPGWPDGQPASELQGSPAFPSLTLMTRALPHPAFT